MVCLQLKQGQEIHLMTEAEERGDHAQEAT